MGTQREDVMAKRNDYVAAILVGVGSLLDLAGLATYRALRSRRAGDMSEWESDWNTVGRDLRRAMDAQTKRRESLTAR
jgi:hypothetical protein